MKEMKKFLKGIEKKIPAEFKNGEWQFNQVAVEKWLQDEKVKR